MAASLVCARCGAPAEAAAVPEVALESGDVLVRVRGLANATCANGHDDLLPQDADEQLVAAVHEHLLVAVTRGVVRRRDACGACGAELVLPPRRTDTPVPFDVDGQVVTVVVDAPMARCPTCGLEQLQAGVASRVEDVMRACVEDARRG